MLFLSLVNNIALLVSLSIVYSLIMRRWKAGTVVYQALSGLLFSCVALIGMMNPVVLMPGLIFDGRSIIISIAGFFGGPLTAAIAVLICSIYRLWLGGTGTLMGVSVIAESAAIGVLFYYLRRRYPTVVRPLFLLGFGVVVHLIMVLFARTMLGDASVKVFNNIALPVILIYPVATLLVCLLFLDQESRLKAEAALRKSEEKYRELVENANSIILRWRSDGCVTFANEFALQFFGFDESELVGGNLVGTIVPPTETTGRDLRQMVHDVTIHPENYVNNENENCCKDGRRVWVRWTNRPVMDGNGNILEVFSVGNDITEHRRAENERKQLEDQLQQARKMEAIGLLAGGVAHDLNNLLSPILGYGEMLLLEDGVPEESRRDLAEMVKAGERARDLVRQLMAFGRKQTLEVKPIQLNDVIVGFQALIRRTLREDIHIVLELASVLPRINADQGQIEQVLMNLAANAQDAMSAGGTLTIATQTAWLDDDFVMSHPCQGSGRYVQLTISDTGAGMEETIQSRVFEPFFTTKELGKGTGLGLATVHGIVAQHGGAILLDSAMGRGSIFQIYLPIAEGLAGCTDSSPAAFVTAKGSETILVAEDDPSVCEMVCTMVRRLGYRVVSGETPEACLRLTRDAQEHIHLLLTDVIMPNLSGRDLYEQIHKYSPGIRVLFMSGYTDNVIEGRGVFDEGVGFIQKPFSQQDLAVKLRQVLQR